MGGKEEGREERWGGWEGGKRKEKWGGRMGREGNERWGVTKDGKEGKGREDGKVGRMRKNKKGE